MTAQYLFSSAKRNAALAAIGGDAIGQIEVDLLKQVLVATVASGGGGGGAAAWGSITGTLSAQTDLQTALDAKLNLTGGTMTGQLILQNASATGAVNVSPTWNNAGTDFAGIYSRVTNTASGANSCLIDVGTVAGGALFKVGKDAVMQINGDTLGTIARRSDVNMLMLQATGSGLYGVIGIGHSHNPGINISSAYHLAWTNDTPASARDITLMRVAASVLGLTATGSTGGATLEMREQTAPSAPGANCVRFYLEDNGAGKSRVMALFSSGAAQQIAIQP